MTWHRWRGFVLTALMMLSSGVWAACSCDDGFNLLAGCCGGDGQRSCALPAAVPASNCPTICAAGNQFNVLTLQCTRARQAGEICGPAADCAVGHDCVPMKVTENAPLELRCVKHVAGDPGGVLGQAACDLLYTPGVSAAVKSGPPEQAARSFGAGGQAAGGVVGTFDVGVVYGRNGEFGCYRSACLGGTFQLGAAIFASTATVNEFSKFSGTGAVTYVEAGAGVVGASFGVQHPLGQLLQPYGTQAAFSVGISAIPFTAGFLQCDVAVTQTRFGPPGAEQWVDTNAFAPNPNGTPQHPWFDLPTALTSLGALVTTDQKRLFVTGTPSVPAGQTIAFPVELHAVGGAVTISAP